MIKNLSYNMPKIGGKTMMYFTVGLFIDMMIVVLNFNNPEVIGLIKRIIEIYNIETKESTYMENESFNFYINIIQELMDSGTTIKDTSAIEGFLLRFKSDPVIVKDPELYTTLKNVFTDKNDISHDRYQYLIRKLNNAILWYENTKIVKKMFAKLGNGALINSPDKQESILREISDLSSSIIKFNENIGKRKEEELGNTRIVDFSNKDTINKALSDFNRTSVVNVMKTGLQGMNRSFGKMRGFPMGSSIVFNALSHHFKGLLHGTPVKVPGGWKNIEDLKVGDDVTGADGKTYQVTGVYPQGKEQIYRVKFKDGRYVDTDADHGWGVIRYQNYKLRTQEERVKKYMYEVKTTKQIMEEFLQHEYPRRNTFVPLCESEDIPNVDLPIHPYVLGVILGDGGISHGTCRITTDEWICDKVSALIPDECKLIKRLHRNSFTIEATIIGKANYKNALLDHLRQLNLLGKNSHTKFIPEIYKNASTKQRLALLQGILDTDGYASQPMRTKIGVVTGDITLNLSNKQLIDDVVYLIRSLGEVCSEPKLQIPTYSYNGEQKAGHSNYRIRIRTSNRYQFFTLPKKAEKILPSYKPEMPRRLLRIESITPLPEKDECTCIRVNSLDHLFVTKDFIVTHNTGILLKYARWSVTLNKVAENIKNPTCLFYSLENEIPQNLMQLFEELYINKYKQLPPKDMAYDQIIEFCYSEFSKYGWKLIMERRLGAEFGFAELVTSFEEYARNGYTPLMCIIDYINMMKKGGVLRDDGGGNHLLLRDLYTNVCNYLKSKNCTLVTAHQLNRKAAESARQNPLGAVKKFGIDMLADGMDPQREIDIAFYQHKELDTTGRAFLTWKLDKHRYCNDTPDKDKYFAYMFKGPLGILDDIDGEDQSTTNIYTVKFDENGDAEVGNSSQLLGYEGLG